MQAESARYLTPPRRAVPREPAIPRPRTLARLYLAFWGAQFCLALFAYHYAGTFTHPIQSAVFDVSTWIAVGALGSAIGYVLPLERGSTPRWAVAFVAGALAVGFVRALLIELLAPRYGWVTGGLTNVYLTGLGADLLINLSFVGLGSALSGAVRNHHEQVRMAALDQQLAESRAAALRAHLRPGMVLRAMDSMADQLVADPDGAAGRVAALSTLLHLQLRRARLSRVPLAEELEFIRAYVELDGTTSGSVIHLRITAADAALGLGLPPNCVSILLESVLRARPRAAADVTVQIAAEMVGKRLEIVVRDDLAVPASARNPEDWETVSDLSSSLRDQFGPLAGPRFTDLPVGVESRLSLPADLLQRGADD